MNDPPIILGKAESGSPIITTTIRQCGGCEIDDAEVEVAFMGGFWICRDCGNNTGAADVKRIRKIIHEHEAD